MSTIEATNLIYSYFLLMGHQPQLSLGIEHDEEGKPHVQVQIDVDLLASPASRIAPLSFFYALDDEKLNLSVIFFMKRGLTEGEISRLRALHAAEKCPFSSLIEVGEGAEVHLFRDMPVEDFHEGSLERVHDYFCERGALLETLIEL